MKKKLSKILCFYIIMLFILTGITYAATFEAKEAPYTEEYIEYMKLTPEERSKVLKPVKYDISNNKNSTNEAMLENEKISLKKLMSVLRSASIAGRTNFSLRKVIANNVVVKNQKSTNGCWAFAAMSSLETNLALKNYYNQVNEKIYDYSERHMLYTMTQNFLDNQINPYGHSMTIHDGGTYVMAQTYLTNGQGAINEEDMVFVDTEEPIDISTVQNKTVQTTVNDIVYFSERMAVTDVNSQECLDLQQEMKEHISSYGAIFAGIYTPDGSKQSENYINYDTGAIYVNESTTWTEIDEETGIETSHSTVLPNHAVSIIGWDDTYSKENFTIQPSCDGAWIVKNSWGEKEEYTFAELEEIFNITITDENIDELTALLEEQGFTVDVENQKVSKTLGDNGLFYVSYVDVTVYKQLCGIISADDTKTYDNMYILDLLGINYALAYDISKTEDFYIANVFTREKTTPEYITSIGISNFDGGTYEVYINPNGTSKAAQDLEKVELSSGSSITVPAGYSTINFAKPYKLTGTNFVIAVKLKHTDGELIYISCESPIADENVSVNAGESFVSSESICGTDDGWLDISDSSDEENFVGNICLKGITLNEYTGEIANPDEEQTPGEEDNPDEGQTPGEEDNPDEGQTPGEEDNPDEGQTPGEEDNPDEGQTPGEEDNPDEGQTPGEEDNPDEGQTPGEEDNPDEGQTPGEEDNPDEGQTPGEEDNPDEGQTPGEEDNPDEGQTPGEEDNPDTTVVNSNFEDANAYYTNIKIEATQNSEELEIKIKIDNIQVQKESDEYEHYFYICSESNKQDIPEAKWSKVDSFEKQPNGTYTIELTINDMAQISDLETDSEVAYIYIKEVAKSGTQSSTSISNGMKIGINTSDINITDDSNSDKDNDSDGKINTTYKPISESVNSSTDATTSTTKLPNTGIKSILIFMGILAIIFVIFYKKYKNMRDI